ncbi:Mdm31p [Sugiyamaella lignohabitans]|uniref:Mdm31p n=1 Tax=Sugiyamaella lignohabitans TaxID=796027 RepID=A0A167DGN7_9ASCO|nr:Mdm31p [Sugiyamaella lignohabitans]ANB12896.1 Mdm31p [Sugiyamaella lignohabitans]
MPLSSKIISTPRSLRLCRGAGVVSNRAIWQAKDNNIVLSAVTQKRWLQTFNSVGGFQSKSPLRSSRCSLGWQEDHLVQPTTESASRSSTSPIQTILLGKGIGITFTSNSKYGMGNFIRTGLGTRNFHTTLANRKEPSSSKPADKSGEQDGLQNSQENEKKIEENNHNIRMPDMVSKHWATKEELLATASGLFERVRIRLKWTLFRQIRPFNTDDISALFSWVLVGNILWILLGTTTFFSLVLLTMNTVSAQDYFARWVGNVITKETGLTVVFENAIVPHWKDGVISFRKVFVSRRPGVHKKVQKGSQAVAAAAAKANQEATSGYPTELATTDSTLDAAAPVDEGNYTQFDLTIDTVSVTLSLRRWIDGKGILKDVEVRGLRGVVDRRHVKWDPDMDPKSYKNKYKKGDFELESFKMEDALVTLYQPGGVPPFEVSIFNCDLPQLRKHWLFYDILSANNMSGSYDNSLFTIHPRQMRAYTEDEGSESPWKTINRLRIDNVNIKHLNRGISGPFGWIESGTVDMLADIMLPTDAEEFKLSELVQDIVERWEANVNARNPTAGGEIVTSVEEKSRQRQFHKYVMIDLRVQLNNTRAVVPMFTSDLTYINNAFIRPIVAYINSRDTYIPVNCRIVKKLADFEGSWTIYDSELMDDISAEVYEAFVKNIADDEARARRMRKVGFWSLQFATQLLLLGLGIIA